MKGLCLLTTFLGGVAAGAAIGMLFAPAKGSDTRANIYDFMNKHGFIEINNYPRAQTATITYTETGKTEVIEAGVSDLALDYEILDMQDYVLNHTGEHNLQMIRDVMGTLTEIRRQWGMIYPFE